MKNPSTDLERIRGLSLQWKLPLLMSGVLLVIVAVGVLLSYREIRLGSEIVTAARLRDFTDGLANSAAATRGQVALEMRNAARNPAVHQALATPHRPRRDVSRAQAVLARLISPEDSGVRLELRDARGVVVAAAGDPLATAGGPVSGGVVTGPDSMAVGSFFTEGNRVYYWNTRPVQGGEGRVGTLARRQRLNSQPDRERDIQRLAGEDVDVLFRNADGSLWTTIAGVPVDAPPGQETVRGLRVYQRTETASRGWLFAHEKAVDGTPWVLVLELPFKSLSDGPKDVLWRFATASLVLLLVGAVALWLVSRRITLPLKRLTTAAEAIARGDYSERVQPRGDYEIARLAVSFNRMASEIASANRELKASAGAAAHAQAAAEAANASKSNFLAAMSHELRTPLNAIAGYVQLLELELRGPLTAEQRNDLTRIKRSQKYLLGLIEEILVFTQLDAHQLAFNVEDVPVDAVIRDAEAIVAQQMAAKRIQYSYDGCEPALKVRADRDKLQQIIINLLVNATKYTAADGSITVSCSRREDAILIHVADTGMGIPEENLGRIFEAFVQLDRRLNQPREGVGLGLTISRDLARAMRGDLSVESVVGKGSTFTLELPKAIVSAPEHPLGSRQPASVTAT